jgi:hypothetical protein
VPAGIQRLLIRQQPQPGTREKSFTFLVTSGRIVE